ncbi:MAG: IclR family transcriptional regulator [Propionibacteriaceae bacterium]
MPETQPVKNAPERVQSVDRVFTLLERLADAGTSLSLSELAERTDLPMATIHRLLRFLVGEGYVYQQESKRYSLGLRMIRLGEAASRGLGTWSMPYLSELVVRFGETANLAILQGDACVYIAQVPSPQSVRMFTEVGRVVLPHSTGVGKAMLSILPDDRVRELLGRTGMPARTEHTITNEPDMLEALERARKLGYTIDDGEQELGVRCVAVPIEGLPFPAALSVSGPSSRIGTKDVPQMAPFAQAVAVEISEAFRASSRGSRSGGAWQDAS